MKIYLTGDTHGGKELNRLREFCDRHPELTDDDFVIILGNALGTSVDEYESILDQYQELPPTILFLDGNEDNYDYLSRFEVVDFFSGRVQKLRQNVIHLMRSEVYVFENTKVFVLGGGDSFDKDYLIQNNIPWFIEEAPTLEDLKKGLKKLDEHGNLVDFVLTHDSPSSAFLYTPSEKIKLTTKILDKIDQKVKCNRWYFGHYHHDMPVNSNKTIVYQKFIRIK